jgi:hypothetical protein
MNDGKPDRDLYRNPAHHLNDRWSLQTDTSTYFLTVNAGSNNLRLTPTANNVSGNTLSPEPYFMHTVGYYPRNKINGGYAVHVDNQYLYSSSYDKGEGWTSDNLATNATNTQNFTNLQVYAAGPAGTFNIALSGNAIAPREYLATINNDSITGGDVDFYNDAKSSGTFPASLISGGTAAVRVKNVCNQSPCPGSDRMVIHKYEITYPRNFNLNAASNFEFNLPASAAGNYLEIQNFTTGGVAPVLYDLTNGKRYVADISLSSLVRIVLEPSSVERKMILASEAPANINNVLNLTQRTFTNYSLADNQGDYLIISNSLLFNGANGSNPVEDYKAYRASTQGGSYTSKIYLVDELVDQFGFGILNHPLAVRNFIRFSRNTFTAAPKHIFIIGKGVEYAISEKRANDNINTLRLNFVPTYGVPASDVLLAAEPGSSLAETSIGRLSAVNAQEVEDYLKKVKQTEEAQTALSPNIADKAWTKNVLHFSGGGGEQSLATLLGGYMREYKKTISDTAFGGNVHSITKESSNTVQQLENSAVPDLFTEGLSLLTYFGHSSSSTLEFNIENPAAYNNPGKYPLFLALGCNAGNIFGNSIVRLTEKSSTAENYVLSSNKGSIGFIASSHFGLVHYLNIWGDHFYRSLSNIDYGKTIGEILNSTAQRVFNFTSQEDFYSRSNVEELTLIGDPAVRINPHSKPDYAIEDKMVELSPFVSILDETYKVKAKFMNIGKSVNQNIIVEVKHEFPNQSSEVIYRDTVEGGIDYADSVSIDVPIDIARDKGSNKITITIDADNNVDELFETNNSITKEFIVYEDEAKPIYPYNYSIINKQGIKFFASTANPLLGTLNYKMEIDTTEHFDSPLKVVSMVTSKGGVLEFSPSITLRDSTVYYWRVGAVEGNAAIKWSKASFIYLPDSEEGFSQSHLFQHLDSDTVGISLDSSSGEWRYHSRSTNIFARNGVWGNAATQEAEVSVSVEGDPYIRSACTVSTIVFNLFDPKTALPLENNTGKYGSALVCAPSRRWNFEFSYTTAASRKKIMDFMDSIPENYYVIVRNFVRSNNTIFISHWKNDTTLYGSNNSLYHKMKAVGLSVIDSFYTSRAFIHIYKKGDLRFEPISVASGGINDRITLGAEMLTPHPVGEINSPVFGPAKRWKELRWDGKKQEDSAGDELNIEVVGVKKDGMKEVLFSDIGLNQKNVDISAIDPIQYPFVQLKMQNVDSVNFTPYQLKYWTLNYDPVPEGVVAPNIYLNIKDTLEVNEPFDFGVAFKNISPNSFDSLRVKLTIVDRNNVNHQLAFEKHKPLSPFDTLTFKYNIDTKELAGLNTLYVEMNPDREQPEHHQFNNYIYKNFYIKGDTVNPFLDVTFDSRHILNNDLISSKPEIVIKLKDDAKWMLLDDTSLVSIKVKYPDGTIKSFSNFNSDTLSFNKTQQPSQSDNTATINFKPYFAEDGTYELIVSGADKSNNKAGVLEYRVAFQVINKAMISNLLNYPNPFTSSTAFVFTLTGGEIPQNLKIQILTVTGKVVREITKQELGPLQIGRNITEFKWDGTDQYGQKLANGIYLYRVITNLNGKSLDKYRSGADDTDKYFNKGYGKMYLMR